MVSSSSSSSSFFFPSFRGSSKRKSSYIDKIDSRAIMTENAPKDAANVNGAAGPVNGNGAPQTEKPLAGAETTAPPATEAPAAAPATAPIAESEQTAVARTSTSAPGNAEGGGKAEVEVDASRPADFDGAVRTDDEIPSPETLRRIDDYVVLDRHGKSLTFGSLYRGKGVARRVLVIFVRHFFCGNCQDYLRTLSENITPEALLSLPVSTAIAVVGCGDPGLIDMYVEATGCPFPVYTDPTRQLFGALGMVRTLALGSKPAYMKQGVLRGVLASVAQGLGQIRKGLATRAGDQKQVGGEFLFEPLSVASPVSTPVGEIEKAIGLGPQGVDTLPAGEKDGKDGEERSGEEKKITWCHRMRTTRDHAEMPELMEVLGLDGHGRAIDDRKRWSKAVETRKGTGFSLASQMSAMKQANGGS